MADNSFSSMVLPHMTYLYENLDLGWRLVNALCDVGLLTWDNREEVMNQKEPRTARINRLLSEILPYRGPDASERFVEALKVSNQKHVVERLKEARRFGGSEHARELDKDAMLQKPLDDDCILYIGPHIGRWRSLARSLGFTEGQIENIEEDFSRNQEEQGIQMLHKWVKKESTFATVGKLAAAAKKIGKGDIAQLLVTYVRDHEHV